MSRAGCHRIARGCRPFTCRELWPDNGPHAWCEQCQANAVRELRRLAKQLGCRVVQS